MSCGSLVNPTPVRRQPEIPGRFAEHEGIDAALEELGEVAAQVLPGESGRRPFRSTRD